MVAAVQALVASRQARDVYPAQPDLTTFRQAALKDAARPLPPSTVAFCRSALAEAEAIAEKVAEVTPELLYDAREALIWKAHHALESVRRRTLGARCAAGRELIAEHAAVRRVLLAARDEHEKPALIGASTLDPRAARLFAGISRMRFSCYSSGEDGEAMHALYQVLDGANQVLTDYHRFRAIGVKVRIEVESGVLILRMPAKRRAEVRRAA
jgi:hypothetical protein